MSKEFIRKGLAKADEIHNPLTSEMSFCWTCGDCDCPKDVSVVDFHSAVCGFQLDAYDHLDKETYLFINKLLTKWFPISFEVKNKQ